MGKTAASGGEFLPEETFVMSETRITRGEFLRGGAGLAAGTLLGTVVAPVAAACQATCPAGGQCQGSQFHGVGKVSLRPYQTLCIFCCLGETGAAPKEGKLHEAVEAIRKNPDLPLTLSCNAGDVYVYQDPGTAEDTPEGRDYNRKRDLDILQTLSLAPGTTLPARVVLKHVLKRVTTTQGVCGYRQVTSNAWKGCPKAASGFYEKACKQGIEAVIPRRTKEEMAKEKELSVKSLYDAKEATIKPHILLCSISQYGGGLRPPYKEDNLPELLDVMLHKNPDLVIRFARGADWAMCAPCPNRVPGLNSCVTGPVGTGGLYGELKDLNVLQRLGLTFDDKMKARELYKLIFEKIPTLSGVCALTNHENPKESLWWDPCGGRSDPCPNYAKGIAALKKEMSL